MLTCRSCIIIPICFIFRKKNKVVKMIAHFHDDQVIHIFMMTRFQEIIYTYGECKSKCKRTVEKRRGGEGRGKCTDSAILPSSCPHQGVAETGLCPSKALRKMYTALACRERLSSRPTRQTMQASELPHLDASTLICMDEDNGLNTTLLQVL